MRNDRRIINRCSREHAALGLLALLFLGVAVAQEQVPLTQVTLVPDASVAANPVNAPQSFTITTAGSYTVTLTDLATPVPLSSMSVAITTVNGPSQTFTLPTQSTAMMPYSATRTATFAAGSYFAQALASAGQPGGTFSVVVTPVTPAGSAAVLSYHDVIAAPSSGTTGSVVQDKFTLTAPGSYTLATNDFQFPAALVAGSLTVVVLNDCSTSQSPTCSSQVVLSNAPGQNNATLTAGPYDLYAYAQASSAQGGLYSLSITGGGTPATAYAAAVPVGQLPTGYTFNPLSSGPASLALTDLGMGTQPPPLIPPLASFKAIVIQGANALLTPAAIAGGSSPYNFTAASATSAGPVQLFVAATPSASTGQGAWAAYFSAGTGATAAAADIAAPVVDSTHFGFAFPTTSLPAGNYTLAVHDFGVPKALAAENAIVVQQAKTLATAPATNPQSVDLNFTSLAGVVNVLIFPVLQATSPNDDLFGVSVQQQVSGVNVFQTTQAVGTLFTAIPVTVSAAGNYGVTFTDLGFPAAFTSVALIGTQGNTEIGAFFPGAAGESGNFNFTVAAPGTYTLNVLAQVSGSHYGLYGVTSGLVPTATLTPGAVMVGGAQDVTLSWTSTNATGCTASGGWSGAQPASGSNVNVGALTQTTSYNLICSGPGGPSAQQSVTVNFTSSSSSSSGGGSGSGSSKGGGAFSPSILVALGLLAGLKLRRRRAMLPS
jgi:hypothetical protein